MVQFHRGFLEHSAPTETTMIEQTYLSNNERYIFVVDNGREYSYDVEKEDFVDQNPPTRVVTEAKEFAELEDLR